MTADTSFENDQFDAHIHTSIISQQCFQDLDYNVEFNTASQVIFENAKLQKELKLRI